MKVLRPKGQSLVEFAFALPILLLLVIGVFDLSRLFLTKVVLNNAAREGAYYLAYHRTDGDCDGTCVTSFADTRAAIIAEAQDSGITILATDIICDCTLVDGDCVSGAPVEVMVTHVIDLAIIDFFSGPITVASTVRMMAQ